MRIRPATRLLRPLPLTGVALVGAGALTATLLVAAPHGLPAAVAQESLPAYDNCAAFEAGMCALLAGPRVGPYGLTGGDFSFGGTATGGAPQAVPAPAAGPAPDTFSLPPGTGGTPGSSRAGRGCGLGGGGPSSGTRRSSGACSGGQG